MTPSVLDIDLPAAVVTNGGPLLAVPADLVEAWRGCLPPLGAVVPEGWAWGSGGVVCDYDRACAWPPSAVAPEDGASTWELPVGEGRALVLDGEVQTAALPAEDGLVFVRDAGLATRAEVLAMIAAVERWEPSPFGLDLATGRLFVFDAAYAGAEREEADGGLLVAELSPGRYEVSISSAENPSGGCVTLIRLSGPRQAEGLPVISVA